MLNEYSRIYTPIAEQNMLFPRIIEGTDTLPLADSGTELSQRSRWIKDLFDDTANPALTAIPGPIRRWTIGHRRRAWEQAPTRENQLLVERKIRHTFNVNMKSYWLAAHTPEITWNVTQAQVNADLHDIGRFPQALHFATFADGKSFNHALMGAKMIEKAKLPFKQFGCDEGIALETVGYHSDRTCPDNPYIHLLRDADKLIIAGEYIDDLYTELSQASAAGPGIQTSPFDPEALVQFTEGKTIENRFAAKSKSNRILQRISWINDYHFDTARTDFIRSQSLNRLIGLLDIYTGSANYQVKQVVSELLQDDSKGITNSVQFA